MILVYTPKRTSRIDYIFEFLFVDILGLKVNFTDNAEDFKDYIGAKLNYSKQQLEQELFIYQSDFLLQKGLKKPDFRMGQFDKDPCLFFNEVENTTLPFDLFAASFYLVTRFEEYQSMYTDHHGRFNHEKSLAFEHNFLGKPLIDIWLYKLVAIIQEKYPNFKPQSKKYKFVPTYDIDIAFAYKYKGFLRTVGSYIKNLSQLDFKQIGERTAVMLGKRKDPYDTYDWQIELQKSYQLSPVYFFLVGGFSTYDRNISIESTRYRYLIQSISDYAKVGIHPSYLSNDKEELVKREIKQLSSVVKREIYTSRQHFIKLSMPKTYQVLLKNEIRQDFSMGYPSHIGFRASTASSFWFYDVSQELQTTLRVYPSAIMDVTLKDYMGLNKEQALKRTKKLIDEVKKVDGLFISIFHNHSLSDYNEWKGWRQVYEDMVNYAVS